MKTKSDSLKRRSSEGSLKKCVLRFDETTWDSSILPYCSREAILISFSRKFLQGIPFYSTISSRRLIGITHDDHFAIYALGDILEKGGEGAVMLAQNLVSGEFFIAKEIKGFGQASVFIEPEKQALERLDRLIGYYEIDAHDDNNHRAILLMPKYPGNSLIRTLYFCAPKYNREDSRHFVARQNLTLEQIETIFIKLILALKEVHLKDIAHCDVNPFNFIVAPKLSGKSSKISVESALVDFGASKYAGNLKTSLSETFGYLAPEASINQHHDKTLTDYQIMDIFSLGVVLAELLSKLSFQAYRIDLREDIRVNEGHPRPMTVKEIKEGLKDVFVPKKRLWSGEKAKTLYHIVSVFCSENPADRKNLSWALNLLFQRNFRLDFSGLCKLPEGIDGKISPSDPLSPRGNHEKDTETDIGPPPLMSRSRSATITTSSPEKPRNMDKSTSALGIFAQQEKEKKTKKRGMADEKRLSLC